MAEFEEKLNSILGDQKAMSQIMALAQSLSGEKREPVEETQPGPSQQNEQNDSSPDLSAMLAQLDPNMIQIGMEIVRQVQGDEDKSTALLNALRPFLREERRARLDRAIQLTRMSKLIRAALGALGGKGEQEGV